MAKSTGRVILEATDVTFYSPRDEAAFFRFYLGVDARLVGVDLQEHVADAQGCALVMGDDDFDFFHAGDCRSGDYRCRWVLPSR